MKRRWPVLLVALTMLILSSCQSSTASPSPSQSIAETKTDSQPVIDSTATPQPATKTPTVTPTFIPITEKSLAGLIISSPILGTPVDLIEDQSSTMVIPNGLGIINSEGKIIKITDAGLFESFSPSGVQIVYQHGFESEFTDTIDNLYVYNTVTRKTVEIIDSLENEGGKTVISWSHDEQQFIYYNDFLTVLFEAYGYFEPKQLLLADVSTGKTKLLIKDGYQFDVDPGQSLIAYTTGKILDSKSIGYKGQLHEEFGCFQPHLYDIASSSSQPFDIGNLDEKPICLGYPKWSPDGKKIAWIGYFEDDLFHPVIFNLQDNVGKIYGALNQIPESSLLPAYWRFSQVYGNPEPDWINNSIFWTPSYEINIETGEILEAREMEAPYNPKNDKPLKSPNKVFNVSLNEERDNIIVSDFNGNVLASFLLDEIYDEQQDNTLTSGFYLLGRTELAGWSPFVPPPNAGNN